MQLRNKTVLRLRKKTNMVLITLLVSIVFLSKGSFSLTTINKSLPIIQSFSDKCVTTEEMQMEIQGLRSQIQSLGMQLLSTLHPNSNIQNPASTCKDIHGAPSNYYWIQNPLTGLKRRVYCDMTRRTCGSTGGWMQVANLDMTDLSQHCPSGFREITSPRRMCGRHNSGCVSATFPVHGVEYSRVCGRVIGYQYYSPDAFLGYYNNRGLTIDSNYVDGVSVTHGHYPRKHIWTFAAAVDDKYNDIYRCPCSQQCHTFTGIIPPFIGNDYFCESGSHDQVTSRYYLNDPLWNGQGCSATGNSCCSFNNPPWFCKQLPQATTDDIEVRLCGDENVYTNEDTPLEVIELYVQ